MKQKTKKGFDIVSTINSITPKGIEFHIIDQADDGTIKKASFCGPNTNLQKRLKDYNKKTGEFSKIITPPINKLDRAAMLHDIAYADKDLSVRHAADRELLAVAEEIINDNVSTRIQKFNAGVVRLILLGKLKLGVGVDIGGGKLDGYFDPSSIQGRENLGGLIVGLVTLAASVGIPAVIKLLEKNNQES